VSEQVTVRAVPGLTQTPTLPPPIGVHCVPATHGTTPVSLVSWQGLPSVLRGLQAGVVWLYLQYEFASHVVVGHDASD
jgi:hypothetical protein